MGQLPASSMEECRILLRKGVTQRKLGLTPVGWCAPGAGGMLSAFQQGKEPCQDGNTHAKSQAGTSRRAHPASGKGEHSSTAAPRGLPPFPPAFPAHGTRGEETGFPCPLALLDHPDSRHIVESSSLLEPQQGRAVYPIKRSGIKARWSPPRLTQGLPGGNKANLLINWD